MPRPEGQQCGNCRLYEHVADEARYGKQWNFNTGYCGYKPPSSKRSYKPKVAFDNWCENWKPREQKMDVSKAIIEEGNRRMQEKGAQDVEMVKPEDSPLQEMYEQQQSEQAKDVTPKTDDDLFVDRSYRPQGESNIYARLDYSRAHVRCRIDDVVETEGEYGQHVTCHIEALRTLLKYTSEETEGCDDEQSYPQEGVLMDRVTEEDIEELAANLHYQEVRFQNMRMTNVPRDPDDRRKQMADYHVTEAKLMQAMRKLNDAKQRYSYQD